MNSHKNIPDELVDGILQGSRISMEEADILFNSSDLALLAQLATSRKMRASGKIVYYNNNIHIEPTNKCVYNCLFCSYKAKENETAFDLSEDKILQKLAHAPASITEIHITGGVHPSTDIYCAAGLIKKIAAARPLIHIKAYTATEIEYMCQLSKCSIEEGLKILKKAGLGSLPGGGAEIFDNKLRSELCPSKTASLNWLNVHEKAHSMEIKSNATMLYGHVESYWQRIDHMLKLRELQDKTGGFNAFIPLKFKSNGNSMEYIEEASVVEDLKMFSVARIFLDNFPHLKAYWPAIGKEKAQMALAFGADDFDGTINDSTSIYSRAGGDHAPSMNTSEICHLIQTAGWMAVERDSLYNPIHQL